MSSSGALVAVRGVLAVAGTVLVGGFVSAAPAAAHVSVAAGGIGSGSGRLGANVAAIVGLIGIVAGGLARARTTGRIRTGDARDGAIAALVLGLTGMVLAVVHLATTSGGFGTGNGRAGAIVALVLGLTAIVVGWRVRARSGRTAAPADPLTRSA